MKNLYDYSLKMENIQEIRLKHKVYEWNQLHTMGSGDPFSLHIESSVCSDETLGVCISGTFHSIPSQGTLKAQRKIWNIRKMREHQ